MEKQNEKKLQMVSDEEMEEILNSAPSSYSLGYYCGCGCGDGSGS